MDPALILFGLGVGILVGMTGMGGGSLMTPLLILVFGIKPVVAVGTDLAYAAVTKTVGGWQHFRKGTVFPRMALWLAVGSVPGALAGVWLLDKLRDAWGDGFDTFMLIAIGTALLLTGTVVLLRVLVITDAEARERRAFVMSTKDKIVAAALGGSVGFVLGITVRRLRHADRDRPDPVLPAHPASRRRHRRRPRGRAAVGGRDRAHVLRQHRLRAGRHDPDRLGSGRVDRHASLDAAAAAVAAPGARHRDVRVEPGAARQGRPRHPRRRR